MRLKNKKIAFYIMLPHHAKYLFPIAEKVRKEGAEILFLTSLDIYPFEIDLLQRGYKFKFVPEYADEKTMRRIRRASDKFCDEWIPLMFDWDGIRHWPFYVQSRLLMTRIEEYICLERMAQIEKPDMFVTLHEMNPWGKELGHVAARNGIPFVTLQEGDYYTDTLAFRVHTEYSTVNLLWGESTVRHLETYRCCTDKMVILGNFFLDDIIRKYSTASMRKDVCNEFGIKHGNKVLAFLIGFDWAIVKKKELWQELCKGLDRKGLVCIFKWHSMLPRSMFTTFEALMKEIMPSAIVLYTYDPYKILAVAHYCIVLGRTTLAKEALAWQRPLFEVPRISPSGTFDSYYDKLGISQLITPLGNWERLFDAMEHGMPEEIRKHADEYVRQSFYKLDGKPLDRALDVISFILETKGSKVKGQWSKVNGQKSIARGRISFIIASGSDAEALLSSLTSLSEGVAFHDWEAVIVVNDSAIKEMLAGIPGDLKVVEAEGHNLSQLYNRGAEVSSGEFLVFMTSGIAYIKGERLAEAMKDGIAGMPIKNSDMTPYCLGIGFDFNYAPFLMKEDGSTSLTDRSRFLSGFEGSNRDAVGGGLIGLGREAFMAIGGFDEGIANHLIEVDICLAAKDKGYAITYLPDCLGVVYKKEAVEYWRKAERNGLYDEWKRRVKFFAKWCGKLPKDDDVIKYMGDWLKV